MNPAKAALRVALVPKLRKRRKQQFVAPCQAVQLQACPCHGSAGVTLWGAARPPGRCAQNRTRRPRGICRPAQQQWKLFCPWRSQCTPGQRLP